MKSTLAAKVIQGFHSQGWQPLGRGGTWAGAMRPLEEYVKRRIAKAVAAEREACAKVVTNMVDNGFGVSERIVAAIRARKP